MIQDGGNSERAFVETPECFRCGRIRSFAIGKNTKWALEFCFTRSGELIFRFVAALIYFQCWLAEDFQRERSKHLKDAKRILKLYETYERQLKSRESKLRKVSVKTPNSFINKGKGNIPELEED